MEAVRVQLLAPESIVVSLGSALRLRCTRDFDEIGCGSGSGSGGTDIGSEEKAAAVSGHLRRAGDEWLFHGPGTYEVCGMWHMSGPQSSCSVSTVCWVFS